VPLARQVVLVISTILVLIESSAIVEAPLLPRHETIAPILLMRVI